MSQDGAATTVGKFSTAAPSEAAGPRVGASALAAVAGTNPGADNPKHNTKMFGALLNSTEPLAQFLVSSCDLTGGW